LKVIISLTMRHSDRGRDEDSTERTGYVSICIGCLGKSRRFVPISNRMAEVLAARCTGRTEGWIFPSARAKCGHITTISKGFQALRARTGVSEKIVPYSARHTYGSYTLAATGNLFAVAGSMGHTDTKSMEPYQHHNLESLRVAINTRNEEASSFSHIPGHIPGKEQDEKDAS